MRSRECPLSTQFVTDLPSSQCAKSGPAADDPIGVNHTFLITLSPEAFTERVSSY